jgi:L-threonylcarbamoyladenylate synthase
MQVAPASAASIAQAAALLREGGLVGMPTETVYGLAGDAANPAAIAAIFATKGRPHFNPLIAHVPEAAAAAREAVFPPDALRLAEAFWPGPLTLVLPRAPGGKVCDLACAGLSTIAVRAPAHPVAQALLAALGRPIAAPSANPSGRISPTTAQHLHDDALPGLSLVLDAGPCSLGLESTIVALLPDQPARLLREGAILRAALEALIGPLERPQHPTITAPGMLDSHYAPRSALLLNAREPRDRTVFIGFGLTSPPGALTLSARGDLVEAAARLYAILREADAMGAEAIAVAPIPDVGLGAAINDRLRRAAAPRG